MVDPSSIGYGASFIFIVGALIKLNIDVQKRVPFEWIETKFQPDMLKKLSEIRELQREEFVLLNKGIRDLNHSIIGDLDKEGLMVVYHHLKSKLNDHEERIEELETKN